MAPEVASFAVVDCTATKDSIKIEFSHQVVEKGATGFLGGKTHINSALNAKNYTIFTRDSVDFKKAKSISTARDEGVQIRAEADSTGKVITFKFRSTDPAEPEFQAGASVVVSIHDVKSFDDKDSLPSLICHAEVPGRTPSSAPSGTLTSDVEDATAYPLLTEEVGYSPSPISRVGTGTGLPTGSGAPQGLGQLASQAVADVLGWKPNPNDAKGFVGALTQSFSLTEIEGHIESTWNPRTYTVQTDLAGGITGAQASLYTRAKVALDECLPLLDGLYALNPSADPEYVKALRDMAKSQITEIVKQFGIVPPSQLRVNTYFKILLDAKSLVFSEEPKVETNPDKIGGTLGDIRDFYGIWFLKNGTKNPYSNSTEDEQDITNFRVISDYMTSLLQTWLGNGSYFNLNPKLNPDAFLGTNLVLISRQLSVINETVNEVRFVLDSVFIGPNERQTLLLEFHDPNKLPAMYLEDVLVEIESSMSDELPRLLKDGGRIAVNNNLAPVVTTLIELVQGAQTPTNLGDLPKGFKTARVKHALKDLLDQLNTLKQQADQIGMKVPKPTQSLIAAP